MNDLVHRPFVSMVVPVYNVEPYLVDCVKSILKQDYQNLDILLINDGSTDNSGKLCDKLATQDSRIKVIHKKNGGLSSARNVGIDQLKGEYIVFVDSDDILHPAYVSTLLQLQSKYDCRLLMCDMQKFTDSPDFAIPEKKQQYDLIHTKECIRRFLRGEWWSAWAKLYSADLFKHVRFPEGRNNEDYAILTRIFEQTETAIYLHAPLYFYRQRPGSITKSPLNNHSFDEIDNCVDVLEYITLKHPEFYSEAEANLAYSLEKLYRELQTVNATQFRPQLQQILSLYKKHGKSFLKNPIISRQSRFFIWFQVNIPLLASFIVKSYILYKKIA